jgi:hypothetical protein
MVVRELLPVLPELGRELLPQLVQRLLGRVTARLMRELYV